MPLPGCQRRLPITSHLQAFILIGSGTMDTRQPLILPATTQVHEHTNTHTQKRNNTIRRSLTHFSGQRGSLYPPANNPVGSRSGRGAEFLSQHNLRAARDAFSPSPASARSSPAAPTHPHSVSAPELLPGRGRSRLCPAQPRARRAERPTKLAKREQGNIPLLEPSSCSHNPPGSAGSNCS